MSKDYKLEMGIIIMFFALPFSQAMRMIGLRSVDLSSLLFVLVILLIVDIKKIINLKFPLITNSIYGFCGLLLYQLYILFIAIIAETKLMESNYGLIYTVFCILLIIALSTQSRKINSEFIIKAFMNVAIVVNFIIFIALLQSANKNGHIYVNIIMDDSGNMIADRLTLSTAAYGLLIGSIVYKSNGFCRATIKWIAVIIAGYNIFATSRRGLMICFGIIVLIHIFKGVKKKYNIYSLCKAGIISACVVMLGIVLYSHNYFIKSNIERLVSSIQEAVLTLIGKSDSYDMAAYGRLYTRIDTIERMKAFNLRGWVLGQGYMAYWIDFPFLQAFYDMGILGGAIYMLIQTIGPYVLLCRRYLTNGEKLILYYSIMGWMYNLFSGVPYGIYKNMYLLIAYYVIFQDRKERKINQCKSIVI